MSDINKNPNVTNKRWKVWFKRLGLAGFLFFLIKGLIWLAVIFGLTKYLS